jgi:hypothetical protein
MDRRLFRRARIFTLLGGVLVGAVAAIAFSIPAGLGVVAGAAWAALNLWALEGLLGTIVIPRATRRDSWRVFLWISVKLGVYGLAFWILIVRPFPAVGMVVGLTVMLIALVLAGLTGRSAAPREATPRGDDADA